MATDNLRLLMSLEVQSMGQELLEQLAGALEGLTGKAEGVGGLGSALASVGTTLATVGAAAVGVGVAVGAAIGGLASTAGEFDQMLSKVQANTTMTDADAKTMRDTILSLGSEAPASLDALAQGFMHASNFGFDAADSATILNVAMKSALSTGGDVTKTTEVLSAALHEFKTPASEAAKTMDELHLAAAEGNMTLEQFTASAGPVFAWAAAVGVPMEQAAAAFAAMTRHGFDAAEAATQVKDLIEHMIKPSSGAVAALEALAKASGVDLTDALSATNLHARGLPGVLDQLRGAMDKVGLSADQQTAEWMQLIPNIRGGAAAFVLTGQGTQDLASILGDLSTATGVTDAAYARLKETLPFQWGVLKNQVQETAITLGEALMPSVLEVMKAVMPLVESLREWITVHADLIASIMEGVAKFLLIAGTITTVVGAMLLLASVLDPLVLLIAAVGVVVAELASSWGVNWTTIQEAAAQAIDWVQQAIGNLTATLQAVVNVASGLLSDLGLTTERVGATVTGAFDSITGGLGGLESSFTNVLQGILNTVASVGASIHDALSYLDPYAEHSPSLVYQVTAGVAEILTAYESTSRIQAPLQENGAAIADFARMGKDALTSLADATKTQVAELKGNLDELKGALAAAKSDLSTLASTPIAEAQPFDDKKFGLDQEKNKLQLLIDQMTLAGASAKDLKPLEDKLKEIGLQASIVDLQEKLKIDPLKRQLQALAGTKTALPFQQIVDGITQAKAHIALLTPAVYQAQTAYNALTVTLGEQNKALQEIAANTKAAAAAAAAAAKAAGGGGLKTPKVPKGAPLPVAKPEPVPAAVIQSVKDYNQAVTSGLHDIATRHKEAAEAAQRDAAAHDAWSKTVTSRTTAIQNALGLLAPIGPAVADAFALMRQGATTAFDAVKAVVQEVIGFVSPFIQSEMNQVTNWWINNLPLIQETTATVLGAVRSLFQGGASDVTGIVSTFGATLNGLFAAFHAVDQALTQAAWDAIKQTIQAAWTIIQLLVDLAIHNVLDVLTVVMDLINGHWDAAWSAIVDMFQTDWTTLAHIAEVGVNLIIGFVDDLIGAWNKLDFHIPGFSVTLPSANIPGVGTVGGGSLAWGGIDVKPTHINPIPTLDSGGLVTGPTLAMLSANRVPEVVAPLPAFSSLLSAGRAGGGPSVTINVTIPGAQLFGSMTHRDIETMGDKLSRYLNEQYSLYGAHP